MLALFFAIDSLLVCSFTSMAQCRVRDGGVVYISEFILLCKQGTYTWILPWLSVAAFGALLFVKMAWMYQVAVAWHAASTGAGAADTAADTADDTAAAAHSESARWSVVLFRGLLTTAMVGLVLVVLFDWRGGNTLTNSAHHIGVAMLATGMFFALQLIWVALRTGDSNRRLQNNEPEQTPWYSWVECDVLFLVFLGIFLLTAELGTYRALGAIFEVAAFVLMLAQTTWLFVLCAERGERRVFEEMQHVAGAARAPATGSVLWALLCAYCLEAIVVLLVVL